MKAIAGFNGYYVTKNGEVYRYKFGKIKLLKSYSKSKKYNYQKVSLYKDKQRYTFYVHQLVAKTFLPYDANRTEVNHKNGNKLDNRLINLEFCNRKENMLHYFKIIKKG